MEALATHWMEQIREARRQGQGTAFYLEVRYEDLLARPVRELHRICRFLDLPYADQMMAYPDTAHLRLDEVETRRDAEGKILITKEERKHLHRFTSLPPQSSRIGRWRTELTRESVAAYEAVAGYLLEELGYPRSRRPWRQARRWFWFLQK